MKISIGESVLSLVQGDITQQETDAITNAANSTLMGGGGVDGAIHRAGGPIILEECKKIIGKIVRLEAGQAVITSSGNLAAKQVIHTVGPIYRGGEKGEPETLASAYRESLKIAIENSIESISFPSISTGVYGYPVNLAARIAIQTVIDFIKQYQKPKQVTFVLFDNNTFNAYEEALAEIIHH